MDMNNLKYLITGTGRSGTVYMARLFTSVGILCGHETIFDNQGIDVAKRRLSGEVDLILSECSTTKFNPETDTCENICWHPNVNNIVADSSYMAAPFLNDEIFNSTSVIHVVRNPLNVINSFCNKLNYFEKTDPTDQYEQFIFNYAPELKMNMPQYDRAALFYIRWNQMIEINNPNFVFKIEDNTDLVLEFLKITSGTECYKDTNTNVFKKSKDEVFSKFSQIESVEIKSELIKMASKYGYVYFI